MSREEQYRAIFDPIVRPEKRADWEREWKQWFVTTTDVEDERFPGKLKRELSIFALKSFPVLEEFGFQNGQFVALAPKTYMSYNANPDTINPDKVKCGTKGIPHSQQIALEAFLSKLYGHTEHKVKLTSLRLDKDKVMSRISLIKRGLTDLFVKFPMADDQITCTPLKLDGHFV